MSIPKRIEFYLHTHNRKNNVAQIKNNIIKTENPLRIGILGAAGVNYIGIIDPIESHPDAVLVAIASRFVQNAVAQVDKYKIPGCKTYVSYEDLIADPNIDAVYIPLPNALHCKWAIKAMEAGKHVLIEKPIASNAEEARRIKETSEQTGKIALEGWHYLFYPSIIKAKRLINSGKYGKVISIEAQLAVVSAETSPDDTRFNYNLGGGSSMALVDGHGLCAYFVSEGDLTGWNVRILKATPRLNIADKRVDEAMESTFVMEKDGKEIRCKVHTDIKLPPKWGFVPRMNKAVPRITVELERVRIEVISFDIPWMVSDYGNTNSVIHIHEKDSAGKLVGKIVKDVKFVDGETEWVSGVGQPWWTTYRYQFEAFVGAIRAQERSERWTGPWTSLEHSIKVIEMTDALYDKAGLPRRGANEPATWQYPLPNSM